jgi:hypothetical protein
MNMKKILLASIVLLAGRSFAQNVAPPANWNLCHNYTGAQATTTSPSSTQMAFSFTFPVNERQTSAVIKNASGVTVRNLWSNRCYAAGSYFEMWDGNDDFGNPATGGPFSPWVLANNIQSTWGLLGTTETSWTAPNNWDTGGGPTTARVFIGDQAFNFNGYTETVQTMSTFNRNTPNSGIFPWPRVEFANRLEPFLDTDGTYIYTVFIAYGSTFPGSVVALYPSGQNYSFSQGALSNAAEFVNNGKIPPSLTLPHFGVCDQTAIGTGALTGVAVQRSGNILAVSHGYMNFGTDVAASQDLINLYNKTTCASLGSVTVTNPQVSKFDNNGNLWVISGYHGGVAGTPGNTTPNVLYEVTSVGSGNTVTNMTSTLGLQNPEAVTVDPTTGDLFIADGGTSQQIKEFNPTTHALISTLGKAGGFGTAPCNATIDPGTTSTPPTLNIPNHNNPTFWFDPLVAGGHNTGFLSPFRVYLSFDGAGDLWVGDWANNREMHYKRGSPWTYVNRILRTSWNYSVTGAYGAPTRIWGGNNQGGFVEYDRNYSVPLQPGDPDPNLGGNGAWEEGYNWMPCMQALGVTNASAQSGRNAVTFANGNTILLPIDQAASNVLDVMLMVSTSGVLTWESVSPPFSPYPWPDNIGNYYELTQTGTSPNFVNTINEKPVTGFDSNGFPQWGSYSPIASYTASVNGPQTGPEAGPNSYAPTSGNIIPIFDLSTNTAVSAPAPAFHLGGLPVGGTSLQWSTMLQKQVPFTTNDGTFPAVLGSHYAAAQGVDTNQANHDIFAAYNGNFGPLACQFWHYRDDGLLLETIGWQQSFAYPTAGSWGNNAGYPSRNAGAPGTVPGLCGDISNFVLVNGTDGYHLFYGDEGYHNATHEVDITGLSTEHEYTGTGALGTTVTLTQSF